MDQRIGPNSPPTPPAGVDPAFVPGLVPPPATAPGAAAAKKAVAAKKAPAGKKAAAEKEAVAAKVPAALRGTPAASAKKSGAAATTVDAAEADEEAAGAAVAAAEDADGAATEADAGTTGDASGEDVADAEDAEAAEGADAAEADDAADDVEPEDDGLPVFEASDRRGAITADRSGVTFRLDSEIAEFGWDEIQAVEFDTARFGRRFSVTVYTGPRRWFESDVEAPSRSALKQWATELDAVLDARFEEGAASPESREAEVAAEV